MITSPACVWQSSAPLPRQDDPACKPYFSSTLNPRSYNKIPLTFP